MSREPHQFATAGPDSRDRCTVCGGGKLDLVHFYRPCLRSGHCCNTAVCFVGQKRYAIGPESPCPGLKGNTPGEYRCELAERHGVELAIGAGCCAPLNSIRLALREKPMIRFVDIRTAEIACNRFAFWNTVVDQFVDIDGDEAWDCWADFAEAWESYRGDPVELERYRGLIPDWALVASADDFNDGAVSKL